MNALGFAERALLGALLDRPGRVRELEWLHPTDFRQPAHQVIYAHIRDMVAEADAAGPARPAPLDDLTVPGVDPVTIYDRIQASGELGVSLITAPGLHTLLRLAPYPDRAQPQAYGAMVLEASIRRTVENAGIRVGQIAENTPDLQNMLDAVEAAINEVDFAQQRWEALTGRPAAVLQLLDAAPATTLTGRSVELDQAAATELPEMIEPPDPEQLAQAELGLIGAVLATPALLDELSGRLFAGDFTDPAIANTYRAAREIHETRHTTGQQVDAVTVAWAQQRLQLHNGPGLTPDQLIGLSTSLPSLSPGHDADLVLRGSLARLTLHAADSVQKAAQHPGLTPGDLLMTTRMSFEAVRATAARMTGRSPAHLAAAAAPVPLHDALHGGSDTATGPATARQPSREHEHGR
ncbi:DnaB-like helicase N terminal domain-containing protein [Lentzea albidocapillata subsp. violacea]|uniref:DnaB-like helicase N terminal domain-containing protein n=1 Tax=Lentzea albidocapillata subsp. violacea TaxID=128104 RepID=A0A1G9YYB5_9PSEU|nr:DnaB-like helicase N-terminal domain-containing protein [Lentzea albidocapillata]SDN13927.1 DnaB-like helicase N terminal domain-containing protein [Lentzea albidocapillata subsp. violacea]